MIETSQAPQTIEGTWEEVAAQASQWAGRRVLLTILPEEKGAHTGPERAYHETASPEEWSEAFRAWSNSHKPRHAPPLSDEAISRETIYGDRD